MVVPNTTRYCVEPLAVSASGAGVGIFFVVAALLAPLPQLIKILRKGSSAGVSLSTLTFCLAYMTANVSASIITKWNILETCPTKTSSCILHLLDLLQQAAAAIAYVALILAATAHEPYQTHQHKCAMCGTFAFLAVLLGVVYLYSSREPCTAMSAAAADVLASIAGVLVIVAFVPQLVETWRCRGRGSASYLFFAIQAIGCWLIAANDILAFHDPWTTFAPFLVGGSVQAAIVALGLFFACWSVQRATSPTAEPAEPSQPFLG